RVTHTHTHTHTHPAHTLSLCLSLTHTHSRSLLLDTACPAESSRQGSEVRGQAAGKALLDSFAAQHSRTAAGLRRQAGHTHTHTHPHTHTHTHTPHPSHSHTHTHTHTHSGIQSHTYT